MVLTVTRLTKKFITHEEGAGLPSPRIVAEKPPEVEHRRFYVPSANINAHRQMEIVRETRCLHCMEKRHVRMNSESESERLLREP